MKALSLWQPWASLIAMRVKWIETRSWKPPASAIGERLAIHAAKTTAGFDLLPGDCEGNTEAGWRYGYIGDFQAAYCYRTTDEGTRGQAFVHGLEGPHATNEPTYVPLGAIVATCTLVDVVPIVEFAADPQCNHVTVGADGRLRSYLFVDGALPLTWQKREPFDVTDQRPFGDFTPGRWAWILGDVAPTTERCPNDCQVIALDGEGDVEAERGGYRVRTGATEVGGGTLESWETCPVCGGAGRCQPVPTRGRQGLFEVVF